MATESHGSTTWDSLSEEDKIKQEEELTRILEDPDTLKQFSRACKDIGQTAVAIDDDFRIVRNGFAKIVEKYGNEFPDVKRSYVPRWDGFMARWNGDTGMLWSSRKLAAETAAALTDYGINLALVADIQSQDDLKGAQLELRQYVEKHPIDRATKVADDFKNLRNDIQDFSTAFMNYIEEQKQQLTEDAEQFEKDIRKFQLEIEGLSRKVNASGFAMKSASIHYVENHPIDRATKVADDFRNDIQDFSTASMNYIEEQKQQLVEDAEQFEKDIRKHPLAVDGHSHMVHCCTVQPRRVLAFNTLLGYVNASTTKSASIFPNGWIVPAGSLVNSSVQCNEVQDNLNEAKAKFARTIAKQKALAVMRAAIEKYEDLEPNIDSICLTLGVFAQIWSLATAQSTKIDKALDEGMKMLTRKKFQSKLTLLIAQIAPLREGIRQYAAQI